MDSKKLLDSCIKLYHRYILQKGATKEDFHKFFTAICTIDYDNKG